MTVRWAALEEGVLLVNNGGRFGEEDRNHVESDLVPFYTGSGGIGAGGAGDIFSLGFVDLTIGTSVISGAA